MAPKRGSKQKQGEDTLPKPEIKRLKAALKYKENEDGIEELSQAYENADKKGKREILAKFAEDSKLRWRFDFIKSTSHTSSSCDRTQKMWLTAKAIAMKEGLNVELPEDKRQLDVLLATMEMRDHEVEELREMGIKQYRVRESLELEDETAKEEVTFKGMVSGADAVKKKPSTGAKAKAAAKSARGETEVQVSWKVAIGKVSKDCNALLRKVNSLISAAQRFKASVAEANKEPVRQSIRMIQSASDALEDLLDKEEETEEHHELLLRMHKQMSDSFDAFSELLAHAMPKALPKKKSQPPKLEDTEAKTET